MATAEPRGEPMDEATLAAYAATEIARAGGDVSDEQAVARENALRFYLGLPFGNEEPDRSQVVIPVTRDVVEATLPTMMKIFAGGDEIVQFEPSGPDDEERAAQMSDYANHVFMKDNPGVLILYTWFKDALIQRNGIVKWWWQSDRRTRRKRYRGLTDEQVAMLARLEGARIVENVPREFVPSGSNSGEPIMLHDVRVEIASERGRACVENVPPEEFLLSPEAKSIKGARFCGHKVVRTVSDLIGYGFDPEKVAMLPDAEDDTTGEAALRSERDGTELGSTDQPLDRSMRRKQVVECYLWVDMDGDGVAELVQLWCGPQGNPILSAEPWDDESAPFASVTPKPMPHRWAGMSLADDTEDIQLIQSAVLRQMLDNAYNINNGDLVITLAGDDGVNFDDLMQRGPNKRIRVRSGSTVQPLIPAPLPAQFGAVLEYMEAVKENRTGITRYNQGTDADSLNKTASGITQLMTAGQERQVLIARMFAETGVRDLFRGLMALLIRHQDVPRTVRLRGKWVDVNPSEWDDMTDMSIAVGLGSGNKMAQAAAAIQIMGVQKQMIEGGLAWMVGPDELYASFTKLVQALDFRSPEPFAKDPSSAQAQEAQAKAAANPPPPNPIVQAEQARAQAAVVKAQTDAAATQTQAQLEAAKLAQQAEQNAQAHAFKMQEMQMNAEFQQAQHQARMAELGAKIQLQREKPAPQAKETVQ